MTDEWPALTHPTRSAIMSPWVVLTPLTRPSSTSISMTSQFCIMSTPRFAAARAKPQATPSCRATPPRAWNDAPIIGYLTFFEVLIIGICSFISLWSTTTASTPFKTLAFTLLSISLMS